MINKKTLEEADLKMLEDILDKNPEDLNDEERAVLVARAGYLTEKEKKDFQIEMIKPIDVLKIKENLRKKN